MLNIVTNKDLIYDTEKYDVILVGTSVFCMLSNGFQHKMRIKYPFIEKINDKSSYADMRRLGTRLTMQDGESPVISLLYICKYPNKTVDSLDYDALEKSLRTAVAEFKGKTIATTVLGSTIFDGNGNKEKILEIMSECAKGSSMDVYDYNQLDKNIEIELQKARIRQLKYTDVDKYLVAWEKREEIFKSMYLI